MKQLAIAACAALTLSACSDTPGATGPPSDRNATGAVYVQTNDASANQVVAFRRTANGQLAPLGSFATGGRGTGMPRLGSQGPMILSDDDQRLFVANVGSSEITSFAVTDAGLTMIGKVASGGTMPFSIALRGNLLYVLNAGSRAAAAAANITAFTVGAGGTLTPIAGSARPLSTAYPEPAQVSFSPDGATLVVTEKMTGKIDTYTVGANGLATGPVVHASNGQTPFGFDFTSRGVFVVTEAFDAAPGQAAASSYSLAGAGGFQLLSGSVKNTEAEVCWAVISEDDRFAYVTNFGTGTLSSYRVAADGRLTLLQAIAGRTSQTLGPRDADLSAGGRYLYVLDIGFTDRATQAVNAFEVQADGGLRKVGAYPLPQFYAAAAGLAAR